ncbi:MAG: potassium channel family protein [Sporichthyaceae bacterium]
MARHRDPVAVVGLGRFGAALAVELARIGTEVLAVDSDERTVARLAGRLDRVLIADCTDPEALEEIGIGDFARVVVAIGSDQQASILTTSLLVDLGIPSIWVKALDAQHAKILHRIGAHRVVLPEHEMGERVAHLVGGDLLDYLEVAPGWVLARTFPPKEFVGVPLGRSGLRAKHRVCVVSVKPELDEEFAHADDDTILGFGDHVLVAGTPRDVERFLAAL